MAKKGVVNIHGKDYKTVALRVEEFRSDHGIDSQWAIITEILRCDENVVQVKASIKSPEGTIVATGHAQESWSVGKINATSCVENCETSAIGRALASAGLAGEEFASADEVAVAIGQQQSGHSNRPPAKKAEVGISKDEHNNLKTAWASKHKESLEGLSKS